ncbi:MAG: cytochrome c3 family protein, partial [Novosphingobium sp.]|nr:cytochrome c3 family protein [Novosphingobium sp.]
MRLLRFLVLVTVVLALGVPGAQILAAEGEKPVARDYSLVRAAPAPATQSVEDVRRKSAGCVSCHTDTDAATMHATPAVRLGCIDCHGGNATIFGDPKLGFTHPDFVAAREKAHVLPRYPASWRYPSSANPQRSYTLLNKEAPEFVRFVNPGDYRVAREACGACHMPVIEAAERSIMASGAMLWGGASYNNGILPFKNYLLGEAYTREGLPAKMVSPGSPPGELTAEQKARGALAALYPLPRWNVIPPGDIFRVFERGGRNINTQFPEIGLPNPTGLIQRLEEPGRPDLKQSNRGPGTGLRVAIPVLNIHKTRLNDPFTWFLGTNDQPGDYRSSGCSACHVVYTNSREPRESSIYAALGRDGQTITRDPMIAAKLEPPRDQTHGDGHGGKHGANVYDEGHAGDGHGKSAKEKERGHPLQHVFTRAIPTAQCMTCHMHQPNVFVNPYLGFTMWDYESDAPKMWPGPENETPRPEGISDEDYQKIYRQQRYPTAAQVRAVNDRNPEGAAARGLWADVEFLRNVYDLNPVLKDTQFADYHGHGWNFRAIFKRDREGNLLDADGNIVSPDDPEKWRRKGEGKFVEVGKNPGKTVHMMDIHAEKGMQCADCHFAQDSHGNGFIYGEVANAVEIGCKDCHGTADAYPTLLTSGPAAPPKGNDLTLLRNPNGERRFEWREGASGRMTLIQRSIVDPDLQWEVSLVKNSVDPAAPDFNPKAARAKLMSASGADDGKYAFGPGIAPENRAHKDSEMACFTCHLSWTTSCGGCHLPIEANWKSAMHHYEGEVTRNFATYNPQVAREDMFQLGRHQTTKGNQIAPIRSSSALVLSSTNINRERIYVQQPPIAASGFSSQAFAPHFPHTVRKTETKTCTDCHLSAEDDNNAIMAQLLLLGTNFVNFVGLNAWVGLDNGFEAVRVTEWDEPQAVIGSYLHRYAYPDYYRMHVERNDRELKNWVRGKYFDGKASGETHPIEEFRNIVQSTKGAVGCLQMRGEYMFVAEGKGGFRVYDIASVGNKGFSDAVITAPFSPLGHDTRVKTANATCMALPTNQPIAPARNHAMARVDPGLAPIAPENRGKTPSLRMANQEQPFSPVYNYAFVTDSVEGLIAVNVNTLADGEFRNNRLRRALTFNPDGVLTGARHITIAGDYAYIVTDRALVTVYLPVPHSPSQPCDLDPADPAKTCLDPRVTSLVPLPDPRATAIQFRYLWVTTARGLELFDVTDLAHPRHLPSATVALADARRVYV